MFHLLKISNSRVVVLAIYVDNIVLIGNNNNIQGIAEMKKHLYSHFSQRFWKTKVFLWNLNCLEIAKYASFTMQTCLDLLHIDQLRCKLTDIVQFELWIQLDIDDDYREN